MLTDPVQKDVKLLPPGEVGMGASRAPPSSPGGSDAAPHARHRAADSSPPNADTHFFMEDGLHVYLSGANGPRAEPTPSSSAASPTPPPTIPRPASCHPCPRASCRPVTPENASHVERRGVNAGAVTSNDKSHRDKYMYPVVTYNLKYTPPLRAFPEVHPPRLHKGDSRRLDRPGSRTHLKPREQQRDHDLGRRLVPPTPEDGITLALPASADRLQFQNGGRH
ncbi:hypothetical protein J1605_020015 [Eschrichtius robustus]|uniref:Uncharacterized protein n=1 Tax=Eschrichtius robustus TaxID=9764 RepID=A0AB34HL00_ESCRO|nr:hypothetical protein J1605_020015 [Eschrichtius robustus]